MQQTLTYTDRWEERDEKVLSHFHYVFPDYISITASVGATASVSCRWIIHSWTVMLKIWMAN